jgi:hypothetical protein
MNKPAAILIVEDDKETGMMMKIMLRYKHNR